MRFAELAGDTAEALRQLRPRRVRGRGASSGEDRRRALADDVARALAEVD
jgi:hypothetical protein